MKKNYLIAGLSLLSVGLLASCDSDPDFDSNTLLISDGEFRYDDQGVWTKNAQKGFIEDEDYEFSHIVDDDGYVYGFTPSRVTDTSAHDPLFSFPYASAAGGNVGGKWSQYFVGYWAEWLEGADPTFSERTCRFYDEDGEPFKPQYVSICCNTYLMYAAIDGTPFSPKFQDGDWVTLVIHGVHLDGTESQATEYLVNVEGTDVKAGVTMGWKEVDLTGLSECTGVYFTMDASESLKSSYGLDVPTYFCITNLMVKD